MRPQIVTCAPSAAKRSAVASPMPLPPPVTRIDQPAMPAARRSPAITPAPARRPSGAEGVKATGIASKPEMKLAGRRGSVARSAARWMSGMRASRRSNITLSSSRAS